MRTIKLKLSDIGIIIGVLLVASSLAILVFSQISQKTAFRNAKDTVLVLQDLMPDTQVAAPDDRANTIMPAVEVHNESFVGVVEIPKYSTRLPVCEIWDKNKVHSYPCRYLGSVYDGSLIIGGSDNEGQFDFVNLIQNDDAVIVEDMIGGRYKYSVYDIGRSTDVSTKYLTSDDADLVIFAKNSFSFDYTVIRCKFNF